MKSVEILGYVYVVGDTYKLNGMFINPGDTVTLRPTVAVHIDCKSLSVDASGTTLEITDIVAEDDIARIQVEAENVEETEVETIPNVEESTNEEEHIVIQKSLTKKKIIEELAEHGIRVDANKTKKQILAELEELSNIELV